MSTQVDPLGELPVEGTPVTVVVGTCPVRDGRRAWVLSSRGLAEVDAREMVVVVLIRDGENGIPAFVLGLFEAAYENARQGHPLDTGRDVHLSTVDPDTRISGFLFTETPDANSGFPAIDRTGRPLLVVPLVASENLAAHHFGHARVLALLGVQAEAQPFPWWFDPDRAPVLDAQAHADASVLARLRVRQTPYLQVVHTSVRLEVVVDETRCADLHRVLVEDTSVVALVPGLLPSTPQNTIWQPDSGPRPVIWAQRNEDGSRRMHGDERTSANFLAIGHADLEPTAGKMEDGVALMLSEPLWDRLLAALAAGESFVWNLPSSGVHEVAVQVRPAGFRAYTPDPSLARTNHRRLLRNVDVEHVELPGDIEERRHVIPVEALAAFADEVTQVVDDMLEGVDHRCDWLDVGLRLVPGEPVHPEVGVPPVNPLPTHVAQAVVNQLATLAPPPALTGELTFKIMLRLLH
jgi:hypothetical protein